MSEAMTNPEIEDVLASIRRLVAQDRKPRPERLILTEEFRVRQANIAAPPLYPAQPPLTEAPRPALAAAVAAVVREAEGAGPGAAAPTPVPPVVAAAPQSPAEPTAAPVDLARLEAAIRELEVQIPPTASPTGAAAPEAAQVAPEPETPTSAPETAAKPAPAPEIVGDDVAFIDEDDLQLLVARIVREELRGQLGERITQQVRKLVRAEIARALDERNLLT